ncbi:MAG TPA: hypothetical protein VMZ26_16180 [Pyrinomonadaceae bacterium]|nr:hypothetical protein [Pyrinomonadaceae bacterium]
MNSIKCKNCGLSNFSTEAECRRCGYSFLKASKPKKEKTPSRFSLSSLLMIALALGLVYYFYSGTQSSIEKVNANDAKRVASAPAERPVTPGLSRTQYDQQKARTYGDAVKNSSSLAAHQQHVDESQKMMQQISNNQVGK